MRMGKEAFLLHGSLFLDMDYAYFESLTGIEEEKLKERLKSTYSKSSKNTFKR